MRTMVQRLRTIHPTYPVMLSIAANLGLAAGKVLIGIFTLSLFPCIYAGYNLSIALAKHRVLAGLRQGEAYRAQAEDGAKIGALLLVSSLCFLLYSLRVFITPPTTQFPMEAALAIAAFTFAELILNLRGVCAKRYRNAPLLWVVKWLNLASSLMGLVLTQRAILSFAGPGINASQANGLAGMFFAGLAALIGGCIILHSPRIAAAGQDLSDALPLDPIQTHYISPDKEEITW